MNEAYFQMPPHLRRRLVAGIASGTVSAPYSLASIRGVLGIREGGEDALEVLAELERLGAGGKISAAWLKSLDEAASMRLGPDLVWTGPDVPGVYARDTRQVHDELIGMSERDIWICTYAYFDGERAFDVLARRMDVIPELQVTILLNIQRRRGNTSSVNDLVRSFADRFWGTDWPGSSRPRVYYDPRSLELGGPPGVLHAKAVVADTKAIFVTSANLTEAAFDHNIEMGLLVRDRALAESAVSYFRGLIDANLLSPLPAA